MACDRTNLSCLIPSFFRSRTAASKPDYEKIQSIQNFINKKQALECRFDWRFVRRDSMNSKQTPITGSSSARWTGLVVIETLWTRKLIFRRKRSAGVTQRRLPNCSGIHGGILQTSLAIEHKILWLMGRIERLPKNLRTKTIETDEAAGFNINHFKWTSLNSCSLLSQLRFASKNHSRKESIEWHWETEQRHKNHLFRLITLHNPRVFVRISTSFFFPALSSGYWKVQWDMLEVVFPIESMTIRS